MNTFSEQAEKHAETLFSDRSFGRRKDECNEGAREAPTRHHVLPLRPYRCGRMSILAGPQSAAAMLQCIGQSAAATLRCIGRAPSLPARSVDKPWDARTPGVPLVLKR